MQRPTGPTLFATALFVLATLGAGCAGPSEPSSVPSTSDAASAPAPSTVPDDVETGAIFGLAMDDEHVPLANVTVAVEGFGQTLSTSLGEFEFPRVPTGTHRVEAAKPGYANAEVAATVAAGDTARIKIILAPLASVAPFHESRNHVANHVAGNYLVETYGACVGTCTPSTCDTCGWKETFLISPQQILIEIHGQHTVPNLVSGDKESIYIFETGTNKRVEGGEFSLPMRLLIEKDKVGSTTAFAPRVNCENGWVCLNEKRDIWFTAFHYEDAPTEFTAFPK